MAKKRLLNEGMTVQDVANKMKMRYNFLKEDYAELRRDVRTARQKDWRGKDKQKRLEAEVRFLRRKYQMFTKKDHKETTDRLVFPKSGAKVLSVSRKPKELTEVLAARRELTGLQALMPIDHCPSPEMIGLQPSPMMIMPSLAMPHSSFVTPVENNGLVSAKKPSKIKDGRNKKTKANLLVSPEYSAKNTTMSRRSKEPTEAVATEDKSARYKLNRMQTKSSTNDCSLPKMTGLQPSAMGIMSGLEVRHSSLITPAVEPPNKKRRLDNIELITALKPFKVNDGRNRKSKAYPSGISNRPEELTEVLATEDELARYELSGTKPLLLTDNFNCTLPEMTRLHPSATRITTAYTVPHRSLVTPIVEPTNKKRPLQNNVIDGRNKKIKCGAENLSIFQRPKEPTKALPIENRPARPELTGLHLSNACTSPKMTELQPSATVPQGLVVRTIVRRRQNNGVVSSQKPPKVKESQRKKTKGSPQKPISLMGKRGVGSFWDN